MLLMIYRLLSFSTVCGSLIFAGSYLPVLNYSPAFLVFLSILVVLFFCEIVIDKRIIANRDEDEFYSIFMWIAICVFFGFLFGGEIFNTKFLLTEFSIILIIITSKCMKSMKAISQFVYMYLLISVLTASVEIGQAFNVQSAYSVWHLVNETDSLERFIESGGRYMGLAANPIDFGYNITVAFTISLFYKFDKYNIIKYLLSGFFFFAIWLSQMRSSIAWCLLILFYHCILYKGSVKEESIKSFFRKMVFPFIILMSLYFFIDSIYSILMESRFTNSASSAGSLARIPMIMTAFNHVFKYPFGMGVYNVDPECIIGAFNQDIYFSVVNNAAHNILGNTIASYGAFGLYFLIKLYYLIRRKHEILKKMITDDRLTYTFDAIYFSILGSLFNAMFHNKNILGADFSSCILLGIYIALLYIIKHNNKIII